MNRFLRSVWTLLCATLTMLASAAPAHASLYELAWNNKWSNGSIIYDASTPDSNPSPAEGDYLGAIVSYNLLGFYISDVQTFTGSGGSITVVPEIVLVDPSIGCAGSLGMTECQRASVTFHLGSLAATDPDGFHLDADFDFGTWHAGDSLPAPIRDRDPTGLAISGHVKSNDPSDPRAWTALDSLIGPLTNLPVATAVPEPDGLALAVVGLGLVGVRLSRRRQGAGRAS